MILRTALPSDASAIAALHTASWRHAYRGILPDAYIDGALAGDLAADWHSKLAGADDHVLLAETAGRLAGFIAVWPQGGWAYIDNLHVDPASHGTGIGRALLAEAAARKLRDGFSQACLWVFAANHAAIRFYDRIGGEPAARETRSVHGHPVPAIRYEWTDLAALRAACL